jgi:hypothetical protein
LTPGYLLRTLWALLFAWYVIERLRVARGQIAEPPLWHNPIAAARRFWRALWDAPALAWGLFAAILAGQLFTALARLVALAVRHGYPQDIGSPVVAAMFDLRIADLGKALSLPGFWSLRWRELLDALTFYPALSVLPMGGVLEALLLAVFAAWLVRHRAEILDGPALPARAEVTAKALVAAGLLALAGGLAVRGMAAGPARAWAVAALGLVAQPILHGATLGLLSLLIGDVVLALPLSMKRVARHWLRLLPSFICCAALVVAPRVIFDAVLPGWELLRNGQQGGLVALAWVLTRLAGLAVLLVWLPVALLRRSPRETGAGLFGNWRALGVAMLRAAVPLAPALLLLDLLRTAAPPEALLPGAITLLLTSGLGVATLGAGMEIWREMERDRE